MKKIALVAALVAGLVAQPAYAMTYFLVAQWYENGSHFCKYSNGTILNVGTKLCALSIEG